MYAKEKYLHGCSNVEGCRDGSAKNHVETTIVAACRQREGIIACNINNMHN